MSNQLDYSPNQVRILASRIWMSFNLYHQHIEASRNLVRFRLIDELKELEQQGIKPAMSSRGLAIVNQSRAFIDDSTVKVEVLPFDNSIQEDHATSPLEKWLGGIKEVLAEQVGFPFLDFFWDYFEAGIGILKLQFDESRAAEGMFPFVITAVNPTQYARLKGTKGLGWVVEREEKDAFILMDEWSGFSGEGVNIPKWLDDLATSTPQARVTVSNCYDKEYVSTFVAYGNSVAPEQAQGELVWRKPHHFNRIPFFEALCVPSHSDKPEEQGMGIIFPILSMLQQENILFSKFSNDAEIGSRPLAHYLDEGGRAHVEQTYPGYQTDTRASEFMPMILQQNEVLMEKLMTVAQNDVQRMTFPEISYGNQLLQGSGEMYRQALSGVGAKIRQFAAQPQVAWGQLYGQILQSVEYFMTPEMARVFGIEWETYKDSCSVSLSIGGTAKKEKGVLALTSKDIKGHYRVRVTLEPNLPQDDTARVDRYTRVVQSGYPPEQAIRDFLQPDHPEEVIEAMWDERLMASNPTYKGWKEAQMLEERLKRDPKQLQSFMQYAQKELQAQQQQMMAQQGQAPQGQPPGAPPQLGAGGAPPPQLGAGQPQDQGQPFPPEAMAAAPYGIQGGQQ